VTSRINNTETEPDKVSWSGSIFRGLIDLFLLAVLWIVAQQFAW
jgi:hypothetical protein